MPERKHTGLDALRRILASLFPFRNWGVRFASDGVRLDKSVGIGT